MNDWTKITVSAETSIRDVMRVIDSSGSQITLVVDDEGRLEGTITDGDIRRAILRGGALDAPASTAMNRYPTTARVGEDGEQIMALMRGRQLRQIPILDDDRHVVALQVIDQWSAMPIRENPVIFMVGGLGTRLLPLTANVPKPMLEIGGRPILEHALVSLIEQGFRNFYFAINHLGEMVENHFGDGSRWCVSINYVREPQRMGTAGALSLLPERPTQPLLVMNGDIMTKLHFNQLMDAHAKCDAAATVCVRNYDYQVPFGVARISNDRLVAIDEKPVMRHFVSAGIYVIDPSVLDYIPVNRFYDMPDLLDHLLAIQKHVSVFPITEYWLDVGRHDELVRATVDFEKGEL